MEFVNGNCTLTKDEHKALVKFLYEKLAFDSFTVLGYVTPAHIAEQDCFCNDFCDADDFEYFYNKYFEGEF